MFQTFNYRNMPNIINYNLLWQEITRYARKVGRASSRQVLLLYYVMMSKDTPKSEKLMLASAIAYVVLPIDIISAKRLPIIGWLDELISLTVAYQKVCKYITPEMERKVDELLDKWFPDYTPYIEVINH
ncbi:MAG: DUF1232 domain-containing protein [Clostridium sp.]|nr:DUF1232 domain-containing protein [Clostridium sp.]